MALFGLIFLVVALILIGVGIFVGAVVYCIAAVLVAVGVLSLSVVVDLLTRRPVAGVHVFPLAQTRLGAPDGRAISYKKAFQCPELRLLD